MEPNVGGMPELVKWQCNTKTAKSDQTKNLVHHSSDRVTFQASGSHSSYLCVLVPDPLINQHVTR